MVGNNYCERVWLNPADRRASGSVVAYAGDNCWKDGDGEFEKQYILEISDCHNKVALHKSDRDSVDDFVNKLKLLRDTIDRFIDHLEVSGST